MYVFSTVSKKCWLVELKQSILIFGSLKDLLGVYWGGCIGGLFMSYLGESLDNYWQEGLYDKLISWWLWLYVEKYGSFTLYAKWWLVWFLVT